MKSSNNVLVLLIVAFVAIIGIAVMLFAPAIMNNFSDNVGFAAHSVYPSFAAPESRFIINGNTISVSDYAIYKTGYYSMNGANWQNFTLSGTILNGSWLSSSATYTLPNFGSGESYIVIYSCTKNSDGTWNCHDNKWQLQIINNTASSSTSITFIPPTPNSAATINISSTEITANITDDSSAISSWIDFDKSLVGYWSIDSYNTNGIYDNSSYKNFGLFTGGLSTSNIIDGVRGKGLSFDGVNDSISLPLSASVAGRGEITLSMWAYFSDVTTARTLYSDYIADGLWKFALNQGFITSDRLDVELRNTHTNDSGVRISLVSSTNTPVNQWVHIIMVYSVSNGYAKLYMNGIEVGSITANIAPFTSTASTGILIGNDGNIYSPEGFSGSLDEVMLFNRALSSSEVKALYDSKNNNFDATLTNLVNGQHMYTLYAIDGDGNLASSSQRTINVNAAVLYCSGSNIQSCTSSIPNAASAIQTKTCNSSTGIWSAYGSCNLISCNSGYTPSGNICVLNNVPTDSTDLGVCLSAGYNCGTPTISGVSRNCGSCSDGLSCTNNLCVSSGKTLYVATNGNDGNNGDINHPFATLEKAWSYVSAGDIIYMRGGTYKYTDTVNLEGKSGTYDKMINVWNYPGEHPIIDYVGIIFTHQCFGISLHNDNYIHFKGIRVTNIAQSNTYTVHYGIILYTDVSNCIFEQMETDHIGGWGVVLGSNCNNNLFLNCDSHHNADPYSSDSYGGSDGFETGSPTSTNNTFRGCRSFWNSDDGWDLRMAQGLYTFENCWSFSNGYIPGVKSGDPDSFTKGGDGEGFKLGTATIPSTTETRRMVKNCLAFDDTAGFEYTNNDGYAGSEIYNSIAYNIRGSGFNFQSPGLIISRNNIAYNNLHENYGVASTHDHNSWDTSGITVSDADFVSLNSSCLDDPRQADGSLPDCNFLHLKSTSGLIDKGVNVGLPYNGKAPDLGAYETG